MGNDSQLFRRIKDKSGSVIIWVTISIVFFLGVGALAFDLSHLTVVRNELQNAADAGALAGVRFLYLEDGTAVNPVANNHAYNAAIANRSEGSAVEVGDGDIERGHWSFGIGSLERGFYPNEFTTEPPDLWNQTTAELDEDRNYINAIRVRTRRDLQQAASYFARIFGVTGTRMSAEAVAYIGYSGTLQPHEVDQPIAICQEALLNEEGEYTCGVGRMINSGANTGHQTGGWTNLTQPCIHANPPTVRPLVCGTGNPDTIELGEGIGATGGMTDDVYRSLIDCWKSAGLDSDGDGWPDRPWMQTFPVITCPGNNVSGCATVVGSVELQVLWIVRDDKNQMNEIPRAMGGVTGYPDWSAATSCPPGTTRQQCWDSFVQNFQLRDVLNNSYAIYENQTIYFLPDCSPHIPAGMTGGQNFGILAKVPVLVR